MSETIENTICWLREDLKVANTCQMVGTELRALLSNPDYFSADFRAYFVEDGNPNYSISSTEPTQVAALKKIINALLHLEAGLRALEELDINEDRSRALVVKDAIQAAYKTVQEAYAAIQLINHSGSEIQAIVEPHFNVLVPKLAFIYAKLEEFTPTAVEARSGDALATVVDMLPTTAPKTKEDSIANVSSFIHDLPKHFGSLQEMIPTSVSSIAGKKIANKKEYQDYLTRQAQATQKSLEALDNSGILSLVPSYVSVGQRLIALSMDLMNAGAPLTQKAYLEAAKKLRVIKVEWLPGVIAELEGAEESLGLKSGVLTDPVIKQMTGYYNQLAAQVDNIATAADVISTGGHHASAWYGQVVSYLANSKTTFVTSKIDPIPGLSTLQDKVFFDGRKKKQMQRLSEAGWVATQQARQLSSAEQFFEDLGEYSTWFNTNLANIDPEAKEAFRRDYKLFQSHLAAHHPEIDKLIVAALTPSPSQRSMLTSAAGSAYQRLWSGNHFTQIMACKNSVLESIQQATAQAQFKEKLIKGTMAQAQTTHDKAPQQKTSLSVDVPPFEARKLPVEEGVKEVEYYHKEGLAFSNELAELDIVQTGFNQFFSLLHQHASTQSIHTLSSPEQELLRKAYQLIQPHVMAAGKDDSAITELNTWLVDSLTTDKPQHSLTIAGLQLMETRIRDDLSELITQATENRATYAARQAHAIQEQPLVVKGGEVEKRTLFGQLHQLQLSAKVTYFLTATVLVRLEENLSPLVWNQLTSDSRRIDLTKLPFTISYTTDSPEVVTYKSLLNAIVKFRNALAGLESLHTSGDPTSTFYRARFAITTLMALVVDLLNAKYHLTQVANHPGLQVFANEIEKIIQPLRSLPIIGSTLSTVLAPAPIAPVLTTTDIVALWNDQQALVRANIDPQNQPKTLAYEKLFGATQKKVNEASPLFHQIWLVAEESGSLLAEKEVLEAHYAALYPYLAESDVAADFPPDYISKLDTEEALKEALAKLDSARSNYFQGSYGMLENLTGCDFSNTENSQRFDELYKRVQPALRHLDTRYTRGFATHLPPEQHKEALKAILSLKDKLARAAIADRKPQPLEQSTDLAKAHSQLMATTLALKDNQDYQRLFAGFNLQNDPAAEIYGQINKIKQELVIFPSPEALQAVKVKLNAAYQDLFPHLQRSKLAEEFDANFILTLGSSQGELFAAIARLEGTASVINYRDGVYDKLAAMAESCEEEQEGDYGFFDYPLNQNRFLTYYNELQPYLAQIDPNYTPSFFDTLRERNDYKQALNQIMASRGAVQSLITKQLLGEQVVVDAAPAPAEVLEAPVSSLQLAAEKLYQMTDWLRQQEGGDSVVLTVEERQRQAQVFANQFQLKNLSFYDPRIGQKALAMVIELEKQITGGLATSNALFMKKLPEIRTALGGELVAVADNAEFHMGFKTGILADPLNQQFEKFYTALVTKLSLGDEQTRLKLLTDPSSTAMRLQKEQQRLADLQTNPHAAKVKAAIFGTPHQEATKIAYYFARLKDVFLSKGGTLITRKEQAEAYYKKLKPFLEGNTFGDDYISSCVDDHQFNSAMATLQGVQKESLVRRGAYTRLKRLSLQLGEDGFGDSEQGRINQEQFLRDFAVLQPYLTQLNPDANPYVPSAFVRRLRTPDDFSKALKHILGLKGSLQQLVKGLESANTLKQRLAQDRIAYFKMRLDTEQRDAQAKIAAFTGAAFDRYTDHEILMSRFAQELAPPFAEAFCNVVRPHLVAQKTTILDGIGIEDDVSEVIGERVDTLLVNHRATYDAYVALNRSVQKIDELSKVETTKKSNNLPNSCRDDVLWVLDKTKGQLIEAGQSGDFDTLVGAQAQFNALEKELRAYEVISYLFDTLSKMKAYLEQEGAEANKVKIDHIEVLQDMLREEDVLNDVYNPSKHLTDVQQYMQTHGSAAILTQDSDNILLQLFHMLRSYLFGWKRPEETMFESMHKNLRGYTEKARVFEEVTVLDNLVQEEKEDEDEEQPEVPEDKAQPEPQPRKKPTQVVVDDDDDDENNPEGPSYYVM